jgi:SAM-dependent methyltransferase
MSKEAYDLLASEYYDDRHKTCRNFDTATKAAIAGNPLRVPEAGLVLEVGCGRGRVREFLGIRADRVVQLDSSINMLQLHDRETCLLKLHADATAIPLADRQFSAVIGFLIDPFLGLTFFAEAFRMLQPGGVLLFTTPAWEWAEGLRSKTNVLEARFITDANEAVSVPSHVAPVARIKQMLAHSGFTNVIAQSCKLPLSTKPISPDIESVAFSRKCTAYDVVVVEMITAVKP